MAFRPDELPFGRFGGVQKDSEELVVDRCSRCTIGLESEQVLVPVLDNDPLDEAFQFTQSIVARDNSDLQDEQVCRLGGETRRAWATSCGLRGADDQLGSRQRRCGYSIRLLR